MARRLRSAVSGQLQEVTTRTLQSRLLLTPSSKINTTIKGCVARAQRLYGMDICAFTFAGNHYHLLLVPDSAHQLARFMAHVNSNIARKIGGLRGWAQRFCGRRYVAIPVSDEPAAQIARLRYILEQGVKENLVGRPQDWPGVHCVDELLRGTSRIYGGEWHDQTAEFNARRRGGRIDRKDFIDKEVIRLSPLPCLQDHTPQQIGEIVKGLVSDIERQAKRRHQTEGTRPLGVKKVLRQDPHSQPIETKSSPAPWAHAATKQVYWEMLRAYRLFEAAFRQAAEQLSAGILDAEFPPGAFPPARPFIPEVEPRAG